MKLALLENVLWDIEGKKAVKWRSENESFYNLPDSPYPHRISKLGARPLTIDEQVDCLYDLCCQPHSRWDDLTELCKAFPLIQPFLLRNFDHRNRDEIKSKLKSALSYPEMP